MSFTDSSTDFARAPIDVSSVHGGDLSPSSHVRVDVPATASRKRRFGRKDKGRDARLGTLPITYAPEAPQADKNPSKQGRDERYQARLDLQRTSARLLPGQRVCHCLWTPQGVGAPLSNGKVGLVQSGGVGGDTRLDGLQTCGSVWSCPICSARISEERRAELVTLQAWSKAQGYVLVMMTLTARHHRLGLDPFCESLALAKRRMQNLAPWKRIRNDHLIGSVSVRESTHGDTSGWHPHYHVLLLLDVADEKAAKEVLEPLREVWLACLAKEGLSGTGKHAWDVQGASEVAAYISKQGRAPEEEKDDRPRWDIAAEMTQSRNKRGRKGGRSPFQILRDAEGGCEASAALWREYGAAMHGRRQQVWSNGLKRLVGIEEVTDGEAAEPEKEEESDDVTLIDWFPREWKPIRHLRGQILAAARHGGRAAVLRVIADGGRASASDSLIEEDDPGREAKKAASRAEVEAFFLGIPSEAEARFLAKLIKEDASCP